MCAEITVMLRVHIFNWIGLELGLFIAQTGDERIVQSQGPHWSSSVTDWAADCGNQHQ